MRNNSGHAGTPPQGFILPESWQLEVLDNLLINDKI
jgi:hypothetical protein